MKRNYFILLSLLLGISILLTGCWNYRETNQFYLVGGLAVDYDKNENNYIIGVEAIKTTDPEAKPEHEVYYAKGKSIFDVIRNFVMETGRRLFWGHSRAMIISEEIAKSGLVSLLDMPFRDAEIRSDMWLLISGEDTAREILEAKPSKKHNLNSFQIVDTMVLSKHSSRYYNLRIWHGIKEIYEEGISPVAPIVKIDSAKEGERVEIVETAVFKGDKMVGALNQDETQVFLIFRDKLKRGLFTIPINFEDKHINVTLEVLNSRTKVEPRIEKELVMHINTVINVGIAELDGIVDIMDKGIRREIENQASKYIEEDMSALVKKVQEKYKSDIFGFGKVIIDKYPRYWKSKNRKWEELFLEVEIKPSVELNILSSALTRNPISLGE